ncbi:MAG: 30S ribosome-binding factor RbfA [Thermoguttaceae bacterium]|nr:30S ribosome-binding factor RbfA [Thermoguttaceae bacterium]
MASRRALKAAEAIRKVVATAILTDIKDPRVQHATITKVEVSPDMRIAKVFFMTTGGEAKERLIQQGLRSAAGYLQQKCAKRIETRYTPTLIFEVDKGVKNLVAITQILAEERSQREAESGVAEAEPEDEEDADEELDKSEEDEDSRSDE